MKVDVVAADGTRTVGRAGTRKALGGGFLVLLRRDLRLAMRHRGELINPPLFFLLVVSLIPLGVSPDASQLAMLAPGIIWVMALLASLLSVEGLFLSDYRDGSLEQLLISHEPLYWLVLAKILAHWLVTGLPLALLAPLLGMLLSLPSEGYWPLITGLAVGTATLSLIGGIGAALTVGLQKGGLLLSLIIMPLYLPVLIFGASAVQRAVDGFPWLELLAIQGVLLAVALLTAPFAAAGALRISAHG